MRKVSRIFLFLSAIVVLSAISGCLTVGEKQENILPSGRMISPWGKQIQTAGRASMFDISHDSKYALVENACPQSLTLIDTEKMKAIGQTGGGRLVPSTIWSGINEILSESEEVSPEKLLQTFILKRRLAAGCEIFQGVVFSRNRHLAFYSLSPLNRICAGEIKSGGFIPFYMIEDVGEYPTGLCINKKGDFLYVANCFENSVSIVDLTERKKAATIPVGEKPINLLLNHSEEKLYAANWVGNTISVIDVQKCKMTKSIKVGERPTKMAMSTEHLFVANANEDTVSVIDVKTDEITKTFSVRAHHFVPYGASPVSVAVDKEENRLYVACAGYNCVRVFNLQSYQPIGAIPAFWYPCDIRISNRKIYILNLKGRRIGPSDHLAGKGELYLIGGGTSLSKGILQILDIPSDRKLRNGWKQVVKNNGWSKKDNIPKFFIREKPIKHIFYILKENRTYDQIFGDLGRGRGDPELALFGRGVTPNHHALAERFALCDNFYAEGLTSWDGQQWNAAAACTDYVEKTQAHSGFPFPHGEKESAPTAGYIFNACVRANIPFRNYGLHMTKDENNKVPQIFLENSCRQYSGMEPGLDMTVKDQQRADLFLKEFQEFVKNNNLPQFIYMWLPNDHHAYATPEFPTPRAMVADNDLAVGRIIEAISKSRYWESSLIFITEDDAQDGLDHVDDQRTFCLVISPYARRRYISDHHFTCCNIFKTIEVLLGMEPLSEFDYWATPMFDCLTDKPDFTPYEVLRNIIPLDEMNPHYETPLVMELSKKVDLTRQDDFTHTRNGLLTLLIMKELAEKHPLLSR